MFSRSPMEGAAFIKDCFRQGAMGQITEWIEREILRRDSGATYSKYNFFASLSIVLTEFISAFHENDPVDLLSDVNKSYFDTNEDICKDKLRIFRSRLCLTFAEAVNPFDLRFKNESPFRESLRIALLDTIRKVEYIDNTEWNTRLRQACRNALVALGHTDLEEVLAAFAL